MSIRNIWVALGIVWIIIVFYLSLGKVSGPIDVAGIDKVYHLVTYCCLSIWFLQLSKKLSFIISVIVFFILMGVGLEFLQALTPYRMFEYNDMIANSIGVILGYGLSITRLGNILELIIKNNPK